MRDNFTFNKQNDFQINNQNDKRKDYATFQIQKESKKLILQNGDIRQKQDCNTQLLKKNFQKIISEDQKSHDVFLDRLPNDYFKNLQVSKEKYQGQLVNNKNNEIQTAKYQLNNHISDQFAQQQQQQQLIKPINKSINIQNNNEPKKVGFAQDCIFWDSSKKKKNNDNQDQIIRNKLINREGKKSFFLVEQELERKKLDSLDNKYVQAQGQKQIDELLNEDHQYCSIKIQKKKNNEQNRSNQIKSSFEDHIDNFQQPENQVFEYNKLLKYLFKKDYFDTSKQDFEFNKIPTKFQDWEQYSKIFQQFFLNEACAQIKQSFIEFMFKMKKNNKYRKIQIKLDEQEANKDGTIFQIRKIYEEQNNEQNQIQDIDEDNKQTQGVKGSSFEEIKDGYCELTSLKNYLVIISNKFQIKLSQLNQVNDQTMLFFGILIEPQKATVIQQIRIQTFVQRSRLNPSRWYNVFLIPFMKITTLIREFQTLSQLRYMMTPLFNIIYDPNQQQHLMGTEIGGSWTAQFRNQISNSECLTKFFKLVDKKYNQSQANSIKEILQQEKGISLLQGPPGTGKTHTLIGILSGAYEYMKINDKFPRKKILICAPSNAAIDEIILRIMRPDSLFDSDGKSREVKVIRIGLIDEESDYSDTIKKVSLEYLAQNMLLKSQIVKQEADQKTTADLRIDICKIQNQIKKLLKLKKQDPTDQSINSEQISKLKSDLSVKQQYLEKMKTNKIQYKESYNLFCEKILNESEIICSTLNSSGSEKLSKYMDQIELLIVDEAAQCTEPSNIIPLRLGVEKMILIGDPKQLAATTFSSISNTNLYNRSLFERILDNNFQPYFLNIQYRMDSEIRKFPSFEFYQNKLIDHESVIQRELPENYFKKQMLFLDIIDGQEKRDNTSYINEKEAYIVFQLIKNIKEQFKNQTIGIISSYKSQVKLIQSLIKQSNTNLKDIDNKILSVNTVDSFQGQEKDIIIFSCVRSSECKGIGFLNDGRRINVALTRAKYALFVIGNGLTLSKGQLWRNFLQNMQERELYRKISKIEDYSFQQILKDEWEDTNRQMPQKLIENLQCQKISKI
ncbi:unnamed protein product [Paramecium primaurelia]|uniref:Uncharacterized protein n=1 Tax=Paramecium primaurelia TaxID=5886 RepID=A0A8S1KX19_PARPR|nr:unnamed protein product [Paramecium primaurelia]